MTDKIIALTYCEVDESLKDILKEYGIHLAYEMNLLSEDEIHIVIANKDTIELVKLNKPIIHLGPVSDLGEFLVKSGRCILQENLLRSPLGKTFIARAVGLDSSLNIETVHETMGEHAFSLKLMNSQKIGYYSDIVNTEAFNKGFNEVSVRGFYNSLMSYYDYLSKSRSAKYPIQVDYGSTKDSFIMQTHASYDDFGEELISGSFGKGSNDKPYQGLLSLCSRYCDVLDIYFLEKSKKLVITGVWFQEKRPHSYIEDSYSSIFISKVVSFKHKTYKKLMNNIKPKVRLRATKLSGSRKVERDISYEYKSHSRNFSIIKLAVKHIKDERKVERIGGHPDSSELEIFNMKDYLKNFPSQKIISKLDEEDMNFIIKALQDPDCFEQVVHDLNSVPDSIGSDNFLSTLTDKLSGFDGDEFDDILKIKGFDRSDKSSKSIKGTKQDLASFTRIKGTRETLGGKNDLLRVKSLAALNNKEGKSISNTTEHISTIWSNRKEEIIAEIRNVFGSEENISNLENPVERITEVLSNNLNIEINKARALSEYLADFTAETFLQEVDEKEEQKLEFLEQSNLKKDQQINKMKGLIDKMKTELTFSRENEGLLKELLNDEKINSDDKNKIKLLEKNLRKLVRDYTEKDLALKKMVNSKRFDESQVTLNELSASDKNERSNHFAQDQSDDELVERLKNQNRMAQSVLYKFQKENQELSKKLDSLKRNVFGEPKEDEGESKLAVVTQLRAAEDAAKRSNLKSKKLEERAHALQEQLNKATEEVKKPKKGKKAGKEDAALSHRVKQLETLNEKLNEISLKGKKDLADKKKEVIDLESENRVLKKELDEAMRKLQKTEKKAA